MKAFYGNTGTAAWPGGFITLDEAELRGFYGSMPTAAFLHAIFYALAHEAAHEFQFAVYGYDEVVNRIRREVEAHADYLAGVWLALRLDPGSKRLPEDAKDAAFRLTGDSTNYPTPHQRLVLVEKGLADSAWVITAERRARIAKGAALKDALTEADIKQTFQIAKQTMERTPDKA